MTEAQQCAQLDPMGKVLENGVLLAGTDRKGSGLLAAELGKCGFLCMQAGDYERASLLCEQHSFDVMIVDITVPYTPWLALLRSVKSFSPDLPVVVLADPAAAEVVATASEMDTATLLTKPFDTESLLKRVRLCSGLRALNRAVPALQETLTEWQSMLTVLDEIARQAGPATSLATTQTFIRIACANIARAMHALIVTVAATGNEDPVMPLCEVTECPRLEQAHGKLRETAQVLEKTKTAFKSKDLGALRRSIEEVLQDVE